MSALFDFADKPNQKAFFHSRARNVGFWGGYGNGKTYAGCGKGYLHSIYYPGNVGLVGRKTYPALNSTTRESFLGLCRKQNGGTLDPGPIIAGFNKQENLLRFRNGSIVFFRTLDEVEKLRSLNLGWALIDQAEEVDEEIYLELNGRIRYWNEERISDFTKQHGEALEKELGFVPRPFSQLICVGNPSPKPWVRKEFKDNDKGQNAVFQASTLENKKFLPLEYVAELEARYPKEWVERFVNGDWNTMLGAIYKEFDYDNIHSIPPFDIPKHWRRFIALDHGVVNATAVLWGALDEAGTIYIYREYYVAGKGVDQHAEAIKDICKLDGSTPETQEGKVQIFMDYAIKGDYDPHGISTWEHYNRRGIFGLDADKRVIDGIQNVQVYLRPSERQTFPQWHPKAGRTGAPKLFIFDGCCPWLVKEMKAYEWKETKEGQNAPEEPKKHFDHACFVAGTNIATENGYKPIESVSPGERVWTRDGLKAVLDAKMTASNAVVYRVSFSNGASFSATGNHPVWVEGVGFVRVDTLRYGMKALTLEETWNEKFNITAGLPTTADLESVTLSSIVLGCTERFGKIITAQYRKAITSITRTEIEPTTLFQTWNAYLLANTMTCTSTIGPREIRRTLPRFEGLRSSGIEAKKAERGIVNTQKMFSESVSLGRSSAVNAQRNFQPWRGVLAFAQTIASRLGVGRQGRTTSKQNVLSALKNSPKTGTQRSKPAHASVVSVLERGRASVFNLSVEGKPEYFAEGVLVHNCDSLRYLCQAVKHATSAPEPQPKYENEAHEKLAQFVQHVFTRDEDEEAELDG